MKVIPFPGVTRLDLDVDRVLEANKGKLESIVMCGYDKEGNEVFASSLADGADVLWLLERMKAQLLRVVDEG